MAGLAPASERSIADREIVGALIQGDTAALARLYDRHGSLVMGLVRRIVGSSTEAEDIVHDIFLEAWRQAADYDPRRGTVRTWLVLRARSRALDHVKSAGVARRVSLADNTWSALTEELAEDFSLAPDCARLRQALLDLPEPQLQVLLLGYFEGLSATEIAERAEIPVGTVKSRTAAAMARLRAALDDGGEP